MLSFPIEYPLKMPAFLFQYSKYLKFDRSSAYPFLVQTIIIYCLDHDDILLKDLDTFTPLISGQIEGMMENGSGENVEDS